MFYKPISKLLVLLLCLSLSACNWFSKKDEPNPDLPPETQTGANTFGCKINGQIWTPAGDRPGFVPNVDVIYDAGLCGGNLDARIHRRVGEITEMIVISGCPLTTTGTFQFTDTQSNPAWIITLLTSNNPNIPDCDYFDEDNGYRQGTITFTKVDFPNRIVSGRFECTLYVPGCDTLKITEGRFDFRI